LSVENTVTPVQSATFFVAQWHIKHSVNHNRSGGSYEKINKQIYL